MKFPSPRLLATIFAFFLFVQIGAGIEIKPGEIHYVKTSIPMDLKFLHMENPYAKMVITCKSDGSVSEMLCTWATHFGLVDHAKAFVAEMDISFVDETLPDKDISIDVRVNFVDHEQIAWKSSNGNFKPMGSSSIDGMSGRIYRNAPELFVYSESKARELDHPLQVIEGKIVLVEGPDGKPAKGSAVVEYYVNLEGQVKYPSIIKSSSDYVTISALKTLEKMKFAPPRKNGNPTFVKIRQPFNFN